MPIVASCGHTLTEHDGEDGMGFHLATKGWSRESRPAVEYGVYCTRCKDQLLAEPGVVLHSEEEELAWCASDIETPRPVGT